MSQPKKGKYRSVSVPLDDEMAAALDRAMVSFGVESRSQMAGVALGAWLAAVPENATIHEMVQLALEQMRKNEFQALAEYYSKRARDFGGPPT